MNPTKRNLGRIIYNLLLLRYPSSKEKIDYDDITSRFETMSKETRFRISEFGVPDSFCEPVGLEAVLEYIKENYGRSNEHNPVNIVLDVYSGPLSEIAYVDFYRHNIGVGLDNKVHVIITNKATVTFSL